MIDLPAKVAKAFASDMREFHATHDKHKRDEIAARQMHILNQHVKGKPLRLSDVALMFYQLREFVNEDSDT